MKRHPVRRRVKLSCDELEPRHVLDAIAAFDLIGLTTLRNDREFASIDGSGVTVAVIDSGIDYTHPLLRPAIVTQQLERNLPPELVGVDFIRGGNNPIDVATHGTHVAGTIGARNPDFGVAQAVNLIGLKIGEQAPNLQATEAALRWVIDNKTRYNILVVNMSLGGGFFDANHIPADDPRLDEILQLQQMGVTVVAAAGNDYQRVSANQNNEFGGQLRLVGAPSVYSTLTVGAVWQDGVNNNVGADITTGPDRLTAFSQRGDTAGVIFAPGAFILSTVPNNRTALNAGTSMASPMVAGVVALMQDAAFTFSGGTRYLTPAEVRTIVVGTADVINDGDDENDQVRNTGLNYPRINAYRAIQAVRQLVEPVAPPPPPPPPPAGTDANGTLGTAVAAGNLGADQTLTFNGTIGEDLNVSSGNADVDLFQVNVTSAGTLNITTSPRSNNLMDTVLRLFNNAGAELASNDDAESLYSRIAFNLTTPGTYFVGVSGYPNLAYNPTTTAGRPAGGTGDYLLTLNLTQPDPNGLLAGARLIGALEGTVLQFGHIGTDNAFPNRDPVTGQFRVANPAAATDLFVPGSFTNVGNTDVDLFRFRAPDDGIVTLETQTQFSGNNLVLSNFPVDTFMRLWLLNPDGTFNPSPANLIAENDESEGVHDPNDPDLGSRIVASVLAGREYLVGISSYGNLTYDPTTLNGRTNSWLGTPTDGFYSFEITLETADADGIINPSATAIDPTTPVVNQPGSIGLDGAADIGNLDVDFYRIRSTTTGLAEVRVDSFAAASIAAGQKVDAILQVFDGNGQLLASNDDTNGFDPLLRFQVQAGVDYFVAVSAFPNFTYDPFLRASGLPGGTGNYLLSSRMLGGTSQRDNNNNSRDNGTPRSISTGAMLSDQLGRDQSAEQVFASAFGEGVVALANPNQDVDLFRFVAAATESIEVRVLPDVLGGAEFSGAPDVIIRVFASNNSPVPGTQTLGPRGTTLVFQAVAGQTYFIGVSGFGPGDSSYNLSTGTFAAANFRGATGPYRIALSSVPAQVRVVSATGDVSDRVTVTPGPRRKKGNRFTVRFTLRNTSGEAIAGPISLVLMGIDRKVKVVRVTPVEAKTSTGSITRVVSEDGLEANEELQVDVTFRVPAGKRLRLGRFSVRAG